MAQKEVVEFIAKVDDSNQVVPANATPTSGGTTPQQEFVNVGDELKEEISKGFEKSEEVASQSLEEAIQSSIAREAQLRVLREINQSIKDLQQAAGSSGGNLPPEGPPSSTFFDDEDNRFDNIPDPFEAEAERQRQFEELVRSFDSVTTSGPDFDQQRFDETTAEFDKEFADIDAVEDTMASLAESLEKPLEVLGILTPELELFVKGVGIATGAISSLVVATQLYSSVLAATVKNFGELSAELKEAQAETEIARIQQQLQFANRFGDVLAEVERNRNELRDTQRGFLAHLLESFAPTIDSITAALTLVMATLDAILGWAQPFIASLQFQATILEGIAKTLTFAVNLLNPFKWFESDETGNNSSVWDNITAPENFLNVDNIRPKNVNGRDVYDMDDLMRKNL